MDAPSPLTNGRNGSKADISAFPDRLEIDGQLTISQVVNGGGRAICDSVSAIFSTTM
jgi:hypothetical protein